MTKNFERVTKMDNNENKKALADEALDGVAGGKSYWFIDCTICHERYYKIGPDGKAYCAKHYNEKWPKK